MGQIRALRHTCTDTRYRRARAELRRLRTQVAQQAALVRQSAQDIEARDLLLAELTHRVRNDFALIVSFLELQQSDAEHQETAAALENAIQRAKSVAVVHRLLADCGVAQGEELIWRLAEHTLLAEPLKGRICLRVAAPLPPLPPRTLSALGIIVNELFMNVAKHAFADERTGTVNVDAHMSNNEITVRVSDDGVGMVGERTGKTGYRGLDLVRSLVNVSLKGSCTISADQQGTTVCIRFQWPTDRACTDTDGIARSAA